VIEGTGSEKTLCAATYEKEVGATIREIFSVKDPLSSLEAQKAKIQELFSFAIGYLKDDEDTGFFSFLLFWREKKVIPFRDEVKSAQELLQSRVNERARDAEKIAEEAFQQGALAKSLRLYRRLSAVFSQEERFQERIGDCFFRLFQYQRAIEVYDKFPGRSIVQVKKIRALCVLGKAKEVFEKSLGLLEDRKIIGWPRQKLFLSKIDIEIQEGKYREAFIEMKDAIETDTPSDELFDRLLDAYSALSDPKISFEALVCLFSKKSSYCPFFLRPRDRMQVEWDVIDYFLRTQNCSCIYLQECLEKYSKDRKLLQEFVEIIRTNIRRIGIGLEEKLENFAEDKTSIENAMKKPSYDEADFLEFSYLAARGINEIAGVRGKHTGYIKYIKNLKTSLHALGGDREISMRLEKKGKIFKTQKTFFEKQTLYFKKSLHSCLPQNGVAAIA
jgi:tetratricopeptide (TPR) repeat protein